MYCVPCKSPPCNPVCGSYIIPFPILEVAFLFGFLHDPLNHNGTKHRVVIRADLLVNLKHGINSIDNRVVNSNC
jgi:hypothetical protein